MDTVDQIHQFRRQWFYHLVQVISVSVLAYAWTHTPVPGFAVAAVTFIGAVLSFHMEAKMSLFQRGIWIFLIGAFLIIEIRSIKQDRVETDARAFKAQQDLSEHFSRVLLSQQTSFGTTLKTITDSHHADVESFKMLVSEENKLLLSQEKMLSAQMDFSEALSGRLVPANDPIPENPCISRGYGSKETDMMVVFGTNASVFNTFPHTILQIGNEDVISVDRSPSGGLALSVTGRDDTGRIAIRIDKNGTQNRTSLAIMRPDKSTFLIQDAFGRDFLRIRYANSKVMSVTGSALHCGRAYPLDGMLREACLAYNGVDVNIREAACTAQQE